MRNQGTKLYQENTLVEKQNLVENSEHPIHASIKKIVSMTKTVDLGSENWSISEQVPSEAWLIFIYH